MPGRIVNKDFVQTLAQMKIRARNIAVMESLTPVRYMVAGTGWLTDSITAGALDAYVTTYPAWAEYDELYIAIDIGTDECEFRKVDVITTDPISGRIALTFSSALSYNHAEDDPVIFSTDNTVNVHWFGAKGNNIANDSLAIQRAIDQGIVNSVQGINVYFPRGNYRLSTSYLVINSDNVELSCDPDEQAATLVLPRLFAGPHYFVTATSKDHIAIRNLNFSLEYGNPPTPTHIARLMSFEGCVGVVVENCSVSVTTASTAVDVAVYIDSCEDVFIRRNFFYSYHVGYTIFFTNAIEVASTTPSKNIFITHNYIYYFDSAGIKAVGCYYIVIADNFLRVMPGSICYGIDIDTITHGNITKNTNLDLTGGMRIPC